MMKRIELLKKSKGVNIVYFFESMLASSMFAIDTDKCELIFLVYCLDHYYAVLVNVKIKTIEITGSSTLAKHQQ
jgi:hypothetical protein